MKRPEWRRAIGASLCGGALLASTAVMSSPTSDEFQRCDEMARASLKVCLKKHAGRDNDSCWQNARKKNIDCYAMVNNQYVRPDPASEAARRGAAMQAEAEAHARAAAAGKAATSPPASR
ncbi:hypothetical protein [Cupriavidus basilensis]|uniref:hypothetical protein n=1 Tax=Cupriavidus basilensis TaxID=68895 RepID=UPI0039F6D31E